MEKWERKGMKTVECELERGRFNKNNGQMRGQHVYNYYF